MSAAHALVSCGHCASCLVEFHLRVLEDALRRVKEATALPCSCSAPCAHEGAWQAAKDAEFRMAALRAAIDRLPRT